MRFLKKLHRRRQLDRDLEDELRFHLEMAGNKQFGNFTAFKEACREMWAFTPIESWWQDVRYALRMIAKSPTVTIVAVVALALGIGANTTVFTVVSSALSFDFGVEHPERLVAIFPSDAMGRNAAVTFSAILDPQFRLKSLSTLAAYRDTSANVSDASAPPERYWCVQMTSGGFSLFARQPVLGRAIGAQDERPDATPVVMLTHRVWQNRYGGDGSIIGRTLRVDDVPRVVVGVMPAGFQFPEDTDLWIPLIPSQLGTTRIPVLLGRLADGVKLSAARAEIDAVARNLSSQYPDRYPKAIGEVRPFLELIGIYDMRNLLYAMFFAVTFVLAIACADVANLLMARAWSRSREISIRVAIGAGRVRIIRQLLVESVVLSLTGGFFGWLVALGGLRWFDRFTAAGTRPSWMDFSMNAKVLMYLGAISVGTGILFGLMPALRLSKIDVNSAVKDGGLGAAGGTRGSRLAGALVVFELVLSVVLLTGAGLLIRSTIHVYNASPGVNPSDVLTMRVNLPEAKYPRWPDEISFHRQLKARVNAVPGVEESAAASHLPSGGWMGLTAELEGVPAFGINALVIDANYFHAMQAAWVRGRVFSPSDGVAGPPVAIVNAAFASKYWPGEEALGKRIRLTVRQEGRPWMTVVGIAGDIQQNFRGTTEHTPLVYIPYAEEPQRVMFIVARTRVPPLTLVDAFRREVQQMDENLPVFDVGTVERRIAQSRLNVGAFGLLFSVFALVALLLALVGLYGVMAHSVSRRTQEIGVRLALGGTQKHILSMVLAQGMRQVGIGLAIGIPAAFAVTRVLRSTLVGVEPGDPVTFAGVIALLTIAGLLGCAIPARRAIRVDPVDALRHE